MKTIYTLVLSCSLFSIFSQNIVQDPSFERDLNAFNDFHSWTLFQSSFTLSPMDSMSPIWKTLYGTSSFRFNRLHPDRDVYENIRTPPNQGKQYLRCIDKTPFRGDAFGYSFCGYGTYDTLNLSKPVFGSGLNGSYDSSFFSAYNAVFFSNLIQPTIKDTSYILSYRLLSGDGIGRDPKTYNFMNNFGAYFSTKILASLNIMPIHRPYLIITNYKTELQDSILDTSLQWRLVRHEFKADSAYQYIHFGQFLDRRRVLIKINEDSILSKRNSFGVFAVNFAFFLDDIRLLPKWQYLDVSNDTNVCSNDSVFLGVLSGAGPYTWVQTSNPSIVLSTGNSLRWKIGDTSDKFQVMSPYDTAIIQVFVRPLKDSMLPPISKILCPNEILSIHNPKINLWNDGRTDTLRVINQSGFYRYQTKTEQCQFFTQEIHILKDTLQIELPNDTIISCYKSFEIYPKIKSKYPVKIQWQDNSTNIYYGLKETDTKLVCTIRDSFCTASDTMNIIVRGNPSKIDTAKVFSCSSYLWNSISYNRSGYYTVKLVNRYQCDSALTLNLTIGLNRNVSIDQGINYKSLQDSVSYQWYRCNPWRKISNEQSQRFTTTTPGSYAVTLDNGKGCKDTSDCIALGSSSILHSTSVLTTSVTNPFTDVLWIVFIDKNKTYQLNIYDISGRRIHTRLSKNEGFLQLPTVDYASGIYILEIVGESETERFKIRKD